MRLLQRKFEVETRYGGGFVQEIDGVGGGRRGGRPVDWFFYVNGIEAETRRRGAPARARRPRVVGPPRLGRRDARPRRRRLLPRAVRVGLEGQAGAGADRLRRERAARVREVQKRLEDAGAKVGGHVDDRLAGGRAACCACSSGRWAEVRRDPAARRSRAGRRSPASSRCRRRRGDRLELLDARGARVRTLGAGSGLVAATSFHDQQPTWVVTGTDAAGVAAAAAALDETRLRDHFAVAIEDGRELPLPLPAAGRRRSDLPPPRQPAARRARRRRLAVLRGRWRAWRCRSSTRSCSARCWSRCCWPAPARASATSSRARCCGACRSRC